MPIRDPSEIELKTGDTLKYSDGAKETVVSLRDSRLLVRTPESHGVVNFFLYGSGLCYARVWHTGLGDEADRLLGELLDQGDFGQLGDDVAALAGAEAEIQRWGGKAGAHRLRHLTVQIDRGEGSGRLLAVAEFKISDMSLRVTSADPTAIAPHYEKAAAYYARLLQTCPEVMSFEISMSDGETENDALAIVCPPFPAPVIWIYGPRQKDTALLTAID